jgi:hypothetical protein
MHWLPPLAALAVTVEAFGVEQTGLIKEDVTRGGPPRVTSPPRLQPGETGIVKRQSGYTMGSDTCGFVASYWGAYFPNRGNVTSLALTRVQTTPSLVSGLEQLVSVSPAAVIWAAALQAALAVLLESGRPVCPTLPPLLGCAQPQQGGSRRFAGLPPCREAYRQG